MKGVGTLDNVDVTGTFAPGFSPATVTLGSVAYAGQLEIELGGTALGSFDRLEHTLGAGIAQLGGSLIVSLINGFVPALGDTFEFLTANGGVNGTFAAETLPSLAGGLGWNVNYAANSVVLEVTAAPSFTADFDEDGDVDGDDLTEWQQRLRPQRRQRRRRRRRLRRRRLPRLAAATRQRASRAGGGDRARTKKPGDPIGGGPCRLAPPPAPPGCPELGSCGIAFSNAAQRSLSFRTSRRRLLFFDDSQFFRVAGAPKQRFPSIGRYRTRPARFLWRRTAGHAPHRGRASREQRMTMLNFYRTISRNRSVVVGAVAWAAIAGGARDSFAVVKSWNTGIGNWSNAAHWSPAGVPVAGDVVNIGAHAAAENSAVSLTANGSVASVAVTDGMTLRHPHRVACRERLHPDLRSERRRLYHLLIETAR